MSRPRFTLRSELIEQLYVAEQLSTREVALQMTRVTRNRVTRWIVVRRLAELGIPLRDRDEAADLARFMREVRSDQARAARCHWPDCVNTRGMSSNLCELHQVEIAEPSSHCQWPDCPEWASSGQGTCFYHRKVALGLIA